MKPRDPRSATRGFTQAGSLVGKRVRGAGASRGFAEMRLLTQWEEIVGKALAAVVEPVQVSYARGGIGAVLTVRTVSARAPEVQLQLPTIRERVNACYGYNAISRVKIVQGEPVTGFADAQKAYAPPPPPEPAPERIAEYGLDNVKDERLRAALESLTKNVLTRHQRAKQKR